MTTEHRSFVLGAYLRPKRSWVLPLWDDPEASPLLDLAFHGLGPDELVLIRTIASPIGERTRKWGWSAVDSLRAGRWPGQGRVLRDLGRGIGEALREMLSFALSGQNYEPQTRGATREQLAAATAAEAKVRGHLIDLEVQILVRGPDKRSGRRPPEGGPGSL